MKREEFVKSIEKVIDVSFSKPGESYFLCLTLDSVFHSSKEAVATFSSFFNPDGLWEIFTFGTHDGHNGEFYDKETIVTIRVFALQVFEQICLDEKLYKEF